MQYIKRLTVCAGILLSLSGTIATEAFSAKAAVISRDRILIVGFVRSLRRKWISPDADGLDVLALEFVPPGRRQALAVVQSITNIAGVYDPVDGSFKRIDPSAGQCLDATTLADGRVLLTGCASSTAGSREAKIYDVSLDRCSPTGSMSQPRNDYSATLLKDGRVLIAGGSWGEFLASAELFDPKSGTFVPAARMMVARSEHRATLLVDGRVLFTGGVTAGAGEARGLRGTTIQTVLSAADSTIPLPTSSPMPVT
jgi:hypothetical protein